MARSPPGLCPLCTDPALCPLWPSVSSSPVSIVLSLSPELCEFFCVHQKQLNAEFLLRVFTLSLAEKLKVSVKVVVLSGQWQGRVLL